ncbi:hypothetical protein ACFE35_08080 [Phormidesmis priestleyi ANT.L61.2]
MLLTLAIAPSYPQGVVPSWSAPVNLANQKINPNVSTPFPEQQFSPKARIMLTGDRVTLRLKNNTYAVVNYQVIGDTKPRTLAGRSSVSLQNLRTPVTLTLDRQDAGLLKVTPTALINAKESLEVTLDTTTDLSADATTLRIENTGLIFLY